LAELFGEVLKLCDRAGLVKPGVVSIDGTRIAGNASPEVNHEFDRIAREIVAETRATDEAEDELYGEARGDELPERLRTPEGRREFFRRARERPRSGDVDAETLTEQPEAEASQEAEAERSEEALEFDAAKIVARVQGREAGCGRASASSSSIAGATRIRSPARGASGCFWRPSGWRASLGSSGAPTRPIGITGRPRATGWVADRAAGRSRIGRRRSRPGR
jgi:hypothetical protein